MPINGKSSITNLFYSAIREDGTYSEPKALNEKVSISIGEPLVFRDREGLYIIDDILFYSLGEEA